MDRMMFIAMSGAKETLLAQSVNNNNLANASTTGFRADMESVLSAPVYGAGHPSRAYAVVDSSSVDFNKGQIITSGRELDVAINGDGWIAVQAPDGSEAMTRAGDLRVDSLGQLTTGAGYPVMGNGGPVAIPPHAKLDIGADGTISIQPVGQAVNTLAIVDRIKLVNPSNNELEKGEDGLFRMRSGEIAQEDAGVSLVSGALETSNVNPVHSMVKMIELARQYETQVKMMKTAEDNDRASAEMMRMS